MSEFYKLQKSLVDKLVEVEIKKNPINKYDKAIIEILKLNRLNIYDNKGYKLNAKKDQLIIFYPHRKIVIQIQTLERLMKIL